MHFFFKKLTYLVVALKTQATNAADSFTKAFKYGNIFIFCSRY